MNRKYTRKKIKTKEDEIVEILLELEKDLSNLWKKKYRWKKKDKTIQQNPKLLTLTKIEYQKIFEENKKLKDKLEITERNNEKHQNKKK